VRRRHREPVGVLLAGGEGRRMGGDKAGVELAGKPLAWWALEALSAVLRDVVVACRLDTQLPALPAAAEAWVEPEGPRGPVRGIVSALREARGRPILVVAISYPLVKPQTLETLLAVPNEGRPAVVPAAGGRLIPLIGRFEPESLGVLAGLAPTTEPMAAVQALAPAIARFPPDDDSFLRIDSPEDLLRAGAALDARRRAAAGAATSATKGIRLKR
jgi:molybdopterin-guanine dinucleotide biosynthesis protein A